LHEVPEKGGDQQRKVNQDEERPAGDPGFMRPLWNKGISYRQVELF